MRIDDLRAEDIPDGVRLSARCAWEDGARPAETVAFEIAGDAAAWAEPAPEAFALLGALAARHHGERRVRVAGALCPRFRDGLRAAMRTLGAWYPRRFLRAEPEIEATRGFAARYPPPVRSGLFLSGGSDSLFALHRNRTDFATSGPAAFRDALFVVGFGTRDGNADAPRSIDVRARQRASVEAIARLAGLGLTVVRSRVEILGEDNEWFLRASGGAHLVAVALLFPRRFSAVAVAASCDAIEPVFWGSHPLLDCAYSPSATEILHEGFDLNREERIAAIARWTEALPHLTVCVQGPLPDGAKNCGRCEKCIRTMLALWIAGRLRPPAPFPHDVDPEIVASLSVRPTAGHFWKPLIAPLRAGGREDLAAAVEHLESRRSRLADWLEDRGWRGRLRAAERRLLGGRLFRVWQSIRPSRETRRKSRAAGAHGARRDAS